MIPEPDYSLCDMTVTSYRLCGDKVVRTVHERAFLDNQKVRNVSKTGSSDSMAFLLIIPGNPDLEVGDKVIFGEGSEIEDIKGWREFIPAKVDGVCVIKYVDRKYINGLVVHVEAGG